MIRHVYVWLFILIAIISFHATAPAAEVDLSLNLDFNNPGDFNSGGTWTIVGKADERGIAGLSMSLTNINFNDSGFLAPMEFDVRRFGPFGVVINIALGDDLRPPVPLDIGVIGGPFPSSYVDDPNLALFMGNPDLGSFTGGVALVTGSFNPGVIPAWATTEANVFVGSTFPGGVIRANTEVTVRNVIPEPATIGLAGLSLIALIATARRRAH